MLIFSPFEIAMLICFGAAWPFSIYRSFKAASTKGKSVLFLFIILAGYGAGILHKILYSCDIVLYLYIVNAAMVSTDIVLYFRNKAAENRAPSKDR